MRRTGLVMGLLFLVSSVVAGQGAPDPAHAAARQQDDPGAPIVATAPSGGAGSGAVGASDGLPPDLGGSPVTVTLITGDRVTLTQAGGELATRVEPGPGREDVRFTTRRSDEHLYVVPSDALALLGDGRLDRRLFDVTGLAAAGYDDAHRPDVPLIVDADTPADRQAPGDPPDPVPAAVVTTAGAEATELPAVGVTAVRQPKDRTGELWEQVVTDPAGAPGGSDPSDRTLAAGIGTIWLDGVRHALLDQSVAQVGAPQAWAAGYTGTGVRVAVLDTGIDATHPDLAGRVVEARNFTAEPDPDDLAGHGTHVASILAGTGAASSGRYRGVAPDAQLFNGKVCDGFGDCLESEILAGMEWAAGTGARIVNMSLGGADSPDVDPLEAAIDTLSASHGILFAVAAGNSGPAAETVASPASADAALAVGAVDDDDQPAEFSSRGPRVGDAGLKPEITAPGVEIVAARARNGTIGDPVGDAYVSLSGTSMATPHVAGAAALVAQQHPDWTGAQIRALLVGSAHRLTGVDANTQGAGRLDVARAVGQAVTAEPAAIAAGRTEWPHDDDEPIDRTITYHNAGPEPVTLALDLDAMAPDGTAPEGVFRLGADSVVVPAHGEASVGVTVDTSVPGPDGGYSAWVSATDGEAGAVVVTTPLTVDREVESYDLSLELRDRAGGHDTVAVVTLFGIDNFVFEHETVSDGTATFRLPRDRYTIEAAVDPGSSMSLMVAPVVELDRDRTLVMDARGTAPIEVDLEREEAVFAIATIAYIVRGAEPGRFTSAQWSMLSPDGFDGITTGQIGPDVSDAVMTSSIQASAAVPDDQGELARSETVYELAWFHHGGMLTGFGEHVRDGRLARFRTTYRAVGDGRLGFPYAIAQPPGGQPVMDAGGFPHAAPLPFRRTVLYNADEGVEWAGGLGVMVEQQGTAFVESTHAGVPRRLRPATTTTESWNQAVHGPLVSAVTFLCSSEDGFPSPEVGPSRRTGDRITTAVAMFGDGAGRPGCSDQAAARTTLLRDGEVVGESTWPGHGWFTVPPEAADYRLEVSVTRPSSAHLSTRTTAAWSFRSAHVAGDEPRMLPLLAVRWAPRLDIRNRPPAGTTMRVPVSVDRLGDVGRVRALTVDVSFDDGTTWAPAPVRRTAHGGFVATIQHPARAGFVSLRAHARDDHGNAVEQTTIRAYELTAEQ